MHGLWWAPMAPWRCVVGGEPSESDRDFSAHIVRLDRSLGGLIDAARALLAEVEVLHDGRVVVPKPAVVAMRAALAAHDEMATRYMMKLCGRKPRGPAVKRASVQPQMWPRDSEWALDKEVTRGR